MKRRVFRTVATITTIAALSTLTVQAQESKAPAVQHELVTELVTNPIEYRALIKRAMEGHLGALGLILTRRAPDADLIPFHAKALEVLTERHATLYPEGSETAHTSERIWSDGAAFQERSQKTAELARRLNEIVARDDPIQSMSALVRLGESCESCHALYRPDAE